MNTQIPASASFRNARRAFTLLEILVVLAIIGMLVGLAVTNVGKIFEGAKVKDAGLFVQTGIKTALGAYSLDMGTYPSTAEGIQALLTPPAGNPNVASWHGPYLDIPGGVLPKDPWGNFYQYAYPGTHTSSNSSATPNTGITTQTYISGTHADVWSFGPDGIDGTADDIGNW